MSNKEVGSLKGVVKSDSSVEQKVYFVQGLQRKSQASIKGRLFEGSIGRRESLWCTLFEGRIVEDYWEGIPHWLIKGMIMGNGQYHTIVEGRDS